MISQLLLLGLIFILEVRRGLTQFHSITRNASGYSKSTIIEYVNAGGAYSSRTVESDHLYRCNSEMQTELTPQ